MTIPGKVSCLMATYGRYARVCEALACFLAQDHDKRELVILNNHHVPLQFDHPLVRIVNEPGHPTLGHCRNRLLDFADGEFCRTWDDDDLYLPWAISQGVERLQRGLIAWKPTRSWWYDGSGTKRFALAANAMEASITWRTDFVRIIGYYNGEGDEHRTLIAALDNAGLAHDEMNEWAGYCYRWGCGEWHCSGSLGNGQPDTVRAADWQLHNVDVRPGVPLVPALDVVHGWYRHWARSMSVPLQSPWMLAAMGAGPAHQPPLAVCDTKIHTACAAYAKLYDRRRVVAPGCWDVLHPGHVQTLEWARQQGEALIVLVNDDDGVRKQKGDGRPYLGLRTRAAALTALSCVDAVVPIGGVDDLPALHDLRPSVLVKGPEYAGREIFVPCPMTCEVRTSPASSFPFHTSTLGKGALRASTAPNGTC